MTRKTTSALAVAGAVTADGDAGRRLDFARQVRDALAHLYDPITLQNHPLARLTSLDTGAPGSGHALREVLLATIESLQPRGDAPGGRTSIVAHQILHLRYVEALDVRAIRGKLALGKSEYYREQQRALEAVTSLLWERWQVPRGASPGKSDPSSAGASRESDITPARRHNLPSPATTYIPRQGELARVEQRLRESRLVTITGSGGCGKTRLAIEVAHELTTSFADGVWLVELAPLTDAALLPQSIAAALDLRERPGHSLLATLAEYLQRREVLLVVDNCEHLIEACARVVDTLLRACPRLRVLATSRELLGVAGEATWRVSALSVVDSTRLSGDPAAWLSDLLRAEAIQLFVDRARLVAPDFSVTEENAVAVAQICQRLDGIPLGIELAAARVAVLTATQIAARLDQRFRLLTTGQRPALPRQQTLRAAIDWSYQLLSVGERALLRRLSVFAGGWTLAAAEAIGEDPEAGDGHDVLDLLTRLAAKSMVLGDEIDSADRGQHRYRLSETIREFAEEKLREADEAAATRNRHAEWFRNLAEQAMIGIEGPEQKRWFDRLEAEQDNLRAALSWSAAAPDRSEVFVSLAAALGRFWQTRGSVREGIGWLEAALARVDARPSGARARALNWLGEFLTHSGQPESAQRYLEASVVAAREVGDGRLLSMALRHLGNALLARGEHQRARASLAEALAVSRAEGSTREVAFNLLAVSLGSFQDWPADRVESLLIESVAAGRDSGDQTAVCNALSALAWLCGARGDFPRAWRTIAECLTIARQIDVPAFLLNAYLTHGEIGRAQRDPAVAAHWYRQYLRAALASANYAATADATLAYALRHYGEVSAALGEPRLGVVLVSAASRPASGYALSIERVLFDGSSTADDALAAARQALGDEDYTAAWAEGQTLALEDAAWLVLGNAEPALQH